MSALASALLLVATLFLCLLTSDYQKEKREIFALEREREKSREDAQDRLLNESIKVYEDAMASSGEERTRKLKLSNKILEMVLEIK